MWYIMLFIKNCAHIQKHREKSYRYDILLFLWDYVHKAYLCHGSTRKTPVCGGGPEYKGKIIHVTQSWWIKESLTFASFWEVYTSRLVGYITNSGKFYSITDIVIMILFKSGLRHPDPVVVWRAAPQCDRTWYPMVLRSLLRLQHR